MTQWLVSLLSIFPSITYQLVKGTMLILHVSIILEILYFIQQKRKLVVLFRSKIIMLITTLHLHCKIS